MFSAVAHSSFVPSRRERDHGSLRPPIPGAEAQPATKGKRDRKLRADVFEVPANTSKAEAIFDLWPLWRRGLLAEAITARRDLMAGRALRTLILATEEADEPWIAASKVRIGAQEQQMIRAQATATRTPLPPSRCPGNRRWIQLVFDAFLLQQGATSMLDARDAMLAAYWEDPDFDPAQHAFYYARVIEIPRPRWTVYDAVRLDAVVPKDVPKSIQDRAYSSPIWYTPGAR